MIELSYKELQEQSVFDVPYRAFEYMQSQQAKIDELSRKVESNLEINKNLQTMVDELIDERDELQVRVDGALKHLDLAYPESWGYCVDQAIDILKEIKMKTDRELFLYELDGHGYTFENMTWLGGCFEDNFLNMAWEMWCAGAQREGYKLVKDDVHTRMAESDRLSRYG